MTLVNKFSEAVAGVDVGLESGDGLDILLCIALYLLATSRGRLKGRCGGGRRHGRAEHEFGTIIEGGEDVATGMFCEGGGDGEVGGWSKVARTRTLIIVGVGFFLV